MAISTEWDDDAPTITVEVRFDAAQMKQLLAGNWVRLDEVTGQTLHEIGNAILSDPPSVKVSDVAQERIKELEKEVEDQEWDIVQLRYYTQALERRLSKTQREEAMAEGYYELGQHNTPRIEKRLKAKLDDATSRS